ncbi:MAG: L,D-transpeptidase [Aquihabitans sp.]
MTDRNRPPISTPTGFRRWGAVLATAGLALTLSVSCSGERPTLAEATPGSAPVTTTVVVTTTTEPPLVTQELTPDTMLGFIATPKGDPVVWSEPDESSEPIEVPATTPVGVPTTFAVVGDPPANNAPWYQVVLPTRPNGSTAWVLADSVTLSKTDLRLFVDLEARNLMVERDGAEVMVTDIAIGTDDNPTPTGATFMTELIKTVDRNGNPTPNGAYGPFAFGLALHSDTITEFGEGGDGQVGIHGTNRPALIGQAVSHGCVRLANDDIQQLVDLELPLGTPVFIV